MNTETETFYIRAAIVVAVLIVLSYLFGGLVMM